MKIKVMLDESKNAKMPARAHELDVGYDLYSPVSVTLYPKWKGGPNNSVVIDTGVHIQLPPGIRGAVCSKSGLMFNHDIVTDGTVDPGYVGSIRVKLFNLGSAIYRIEKGQKIAQLVLEKVITPELELADSLEDTDRGSGGFGSTGKF